MDKKLNHDQMLITFLGTFAVFGCYISAFCGQFPYITLLSILFIPIFLFLQYLVYQKNRKVLLGFMIGFVLLGLIMKDALLNDFKFLYNIMVDVYAAHDHYVFQKYDIFAYDWQGNIVSSLGSGIKGLFYVFTWYVLLVSFIMQRRKGYFLIFLCSFSIFATTFFYRIPQNIFFLALLVMYWLALFFLRSMQHQSMSSDAQHQSVKRVMVVSLCITLLSMCLLPEAFYKENSKVEYLRANFVAQYHKLRGQQMDEQKVGEVNLNIAGDRYYSGAVHLQVKSSEKSKLYLKEYSGDIYEDNHWSSLPDNVYAHEDINWSEMILWITEYMDILKASQEDFRTYEVKDLRSESNYSPIPYYLAPPLTDFTTQYDVFVKKNGTEKTYRTWNTSKIKFKRSDAKTAYEQFVERNYTQIPSEVSALFDELKLKDQMKDVQGDVTKLHAWIKEYLASSATYSLAPGAVPTGYDFIRYFLTENKEGYCVHFATTATMLFRYAGIPARYVEGYRVDTKDYNQDGMAQVKDSDAHAWVEIFDSNYGWTPLEVTPAARTNASNQPTTSSNGPAESTPSDQTQKPATPTSKETANSSFDFHLQMMIPFVGFLLCLMIIGLQRHIRLRRLQHQLQNPDHKAAVRAYVPYLHHWQKYQSCDTEVIDDILEKACYSPHMITNTEYDRVVQEVKKLTKIMFEKSSILQKLRILFIDVLK